MEIHRSMATDEYFHCTSSSERNALDNLTTVTIPRRRRADKVGWRSGGNPDRWGEVR